MTPINRTAFRFGVITFTLSMFSILFLPDLVRELGYVLPGKGGTSCKIIYARRAYLAFRECKRGFWYGEKLTCKSKMNLINKRWWPLVQVGSIPTLLGTPRPLLVEVRSRMQRSFDTPTGVFMLVDTDCYVTYSLSGGP